jgi:leucyl-tRNA synthetase
MAIDIDNLEVAISEIMEEYGVDTTRFFMVSVSSPDKGFNWSDKEIKGSRKFLDKIIQTFEKIKIGKTSEDFEIKLNKTIKDITKNVEEIYGFRDATIQLRELFELLSEQKQASKETLERSLKILSPFCPHITEELWEKVLPKEVEVLI